MKWDWDTPRAVSINSTSYKGSDTNFLTYEMAYWLNDEFPLIPLPIKEAMRQKYTRRVKDTKRTRFPLIPLPIKEAIYEYNVAAHFQTWDVSINSTSYKGSDLQEHWWSKSTTLQFPLIPLPIKEAISYPKMGREAPRVTSFH